LKELWFTEIAIPVFELEPELEAGPGAEGGPEYSLPICAALFPGNPVTASDKQKMMVLSCRDTALVGVGCVAFIVL
jgi:hypothetical protein